MIIQANQESLSKLSPALRHALDDTLYENEELLWFDHPNSFINKRFLRLIWLMGCCLSGFLIVATIGTAALRLYYKNDIFGNKTFVMMLLIAIALAGGVMFFTFVVNRCCAFFDGKRSLYALTDTRAIIIEPRPFSRVCLSTCFKLDDKLVKKVKIRGNEGDIVFEEQLYDNKYFIEKGFMRCPNVKAVAEYIHQYTTKELAHEKLV